MGSAPNCADVVIVGDKTDPHVAAVLASLGHRGVCTAVLDAATLARSSFWMDDEGLVVGLSDGPMSINGPAKGWIRRFAPDRWYHGLVVGSKDAVIKTSWLALLAAAMRTGAVEWLTEPDRVVTAEDKLWQRKTALRLGIPVPETVVASSVHDVVAALGQPFVVKPLGPAEFVDDGELRAVFTAELSGDYPAANSLDRAPFIAQRRLNAERHLRVVTVAHEAWVCGLEAPDCIDWRCSADAHSSFSLIDESDVAARSVALAQEMSVGYSSQDWIVEDCTAYFIDLNPAGQWLFLPDDVGSQVAEALAAWLTA